MVGPTLNREGRSVEPEVDILPLAGRYMPVGARSLGEGTEEKEDNQIGLKRLLMSTGKLRHPYSRALTRRTMVQY